MRLAVVAVGRLRDPNLRALADDYLGRIRRYTRCDEIEVRGAKDLERALPPGYRVTALEVEGRVQTSLEFARSLGLEAQKQKGELAFVIGGAEGLPPEISRAADERLSLSALTLPHRLVRVVLYEQLYRALTILRGEPYARED